MSVAEVMASPLADSGAMKVGAPMLVMSVVRWGSMGVAEPPELVRVAFQLLSINTLAGVMSRCSRLRAWAMASASAGWMPMLAATCRGNGPKLASSVSALLAAMGGCSGCADSASDSGSGGLTYKNIRIDQHHVGPIR